MVCNIDVRLVTITIMYVDLPHICLGYMHLGVYHRPHSGDELLSEGAFPICRSIKDQYILDAVTSSGILKAKQKLGRTFNSDRLGGIAFTKISKLTMCSA